MRNVMMCAFTILLAGCSTSQPMIDYSPQTDFSQYRSFAFISDHPLIRGEGAETGSPLLEGRLMHTTENILASRGFRRVADRERADIAIAFTVGGREKIKVTNYPEPYRPSYNRWGWGAGHYVGETTVQQYTEGTLAVDIYDVKERKPVWHGRAMRKISKKMQENPGETVREIVSEIFATFPPPA